MKGTTINVLDKGYVTLVDYMGSDLSVVNAARASYAKEKTEMEKKDERLIKFLAEHGHMSPFRHATVTFQISAPMMVARQWFKYRIGSSHTADTAEMIGYNNGDDDGFDDTLNARNEASRRYITIDTEFYIPKANEWRSKPENSKQGSGEKIDSVMGSIFTWELERYIKMGEKLYEQLMDKGVCAEQARLALPMYGLYTSWRWTCSLAAVAHFLNQRLNNDAQVEIQEYAKAIYELVKPLFDVSMKSLIDLEEYK